MVRQGLIAVFLWLIAFVVVAEPTSVKAKVEPIFAAAPKPAPDSALPIFPDSQLAVIKKRGYLKVGIFLRNAEPFVIQKNNQLTGIDIDLAKIMGEHLGVKVVFDTSAQRYNDLFWKAYTHQDDIIMSGVIRTLARGESLYLSSPYYKFQVGLLANRVKYDNLSGNVTTVFNKSGVIIGQMQDSAFIDYAHYLYPKATVKEFQNTQELFQALQAGKIDATLIDKVGAQSWLNAKPQRALTTRYYLQKDLYAEYVIATSYNYPILGKWLDLFTEQAIDIGFMDKLLTKYTEVNVDANNE